MDEKVFTSLHTIISEVVKGNINFYRRTVRTGSNSSSHINIPKKNIGKRAIIAILDD